MYELSIVTQISTYIGCGTDQIWGIPQLPRVGKEGKEVFYNLKWLQELWGLGWACPHVESKSPV